MAMSVNFNQMSANAQRNLGLSTSAMAGSMQKLSSGYRINNAADDPAGLVQSEKLRGQISGLNAAIKNTEKAVNLVNTAEGALDQVNQLLLKARSLAVDSSNAAVNDTDVFTANKSELTEVLASINRIASNTQYGTKKLLDGTFSSQIFQIGANQNQTVSVTISNSNTTTLSINSIQVTSASTATSAIASLDSAINTVSNQRGTLGAVVADNFNPTLQSLRISSENLSASESTIRDTDYTSEMANFTRNQIKVQAGTAMLAQANQLPNILLQLLR